MRILGLMGVSSSILDRSEVQLMFMMAVDTLTGWWGDSLGSPSTSAAIDVSWRIHACTFWVTHAMLPVTQYA